MDKHSFMEISVIAIVSLLLATSIGLSLTSANGQPLHTNKTSTATTSSVAPIPVLLIHDYLSDASVWKKWEAFLNKDHIPYVKVHFGSPLGPLYGPYYDECGTANHHANDLRNIIQQTIQDMKKIVFVRYIAKAQ